MRHPRRFERDRESPRLWRRAEERREVFYTETELQPPSVYGERRVSWEGAVLRRWEPSRSKLGAALVKGYQGRLPRPGERWLYLGAASGTTASHVADLVGPSGTVYAVERSLRPFARLLGLAERSENLLPILGDARRPELYEGEVRAVDGVYSDVAQPDQVAIVRANASRLLRADGTLLIALKTASMGRGRDARGHLEAARAALGEVFEIVATGPLEPFHKGHFLVEALATRALFREPGTAAAARRR